MVQEGASVCGARQRVPNGMPHPPWLVLVSWNLHRKHRHGTDIIHRGSCTSNTMATTLAQPLGAFATTTCLSNGRTDRQAGRQADMMTTCLSRWTDGQTYAQTYRQTGRQAQAGTRTERDTEREITNQAHGHALPRIDGMSRLTRSCIMLPCKAHSAL